MASQLTVIAPGLLDAISNPLQTLEPMPALESLLSLAEKSPIPYASYENTLWTQFAETPAVNVDVPAAAIQRQAVFGDAQDYFWIWAEPTHLVADQTQLVMDNPESLDISEEQGQQLIAELNAAYRQSDFTFFSQGNNSWYLRVSQPPRITTVPLSKVLGRNIDPFLPSGPDHKHWHGLMNEMQMILHASQVNQNREMEGLAKINSVWFWGGGALPKSFHGEWDAVIANDPLAVAMAKMARIDHYPMPKNLTTLLDEMNADVGESKPGFKRMLVISDRYSRTEEYEKYIFTPIVKSKHRFLEIQLYADSDCMFTIRPRWRWAFWKRRKSVDAYFQS